MAEVILENVICQGGCSRQGLLLQIGHPWIPERGALPEVTTRHSPAQSHIYITKHIQKTHPKRSHSDLRMFNISKGNSGLRLHNCPGPVAAALLPASPASTNAAGLHMGSSGSEISAALLWHRGFSVQEQRGFSPRWPPAARCSRKGEQPLHNWSWRTGDKSPRHRGNQATSTNSHLPQITPTFHQSRSQLSALIPGFHTISLFSV